MPPNDVPFTALPPLAEFTLGNWQAPHTTPLSFPVRRQVLLSSGWR